ncbi:MAG: PP2C family protein-serine/threonine phosphatase [Ilumatobacter sp.]
MQLQRVNPVFIAVAMYVLYVIGGSLAWLTINASGLGAVFFPPAGVTVAMLLLLPRNRWPLIAGAVLLGEITTGTTVGAMTNIPALLGFGVANAVGPLLAALVVGSLVGRCADGVTNLDVGRRRDLVMFGLGAVAFGPLVSGVIGGLVAMWQFGSSPVSVAPQWWLGDALGVVVVAPLLLAWNATAGGRSWRGLTAAALVVGTGVAAVATLGLTDLPLMFLVLAMLVVAGVVFDVRVIALTGLVIAGSVGVSLAVAPESLISGLTPSEALTAMKLEFLVFVVTAYLVSAETNERVIATDDAAHRLSTVGELQRLLLPPLMLTGPGYRSRGVYDAARHDIGVGGDWYLLRESVDGRLVFAVGDIVGHDLDAARSMASVRSGLALDAVIDPDPALLLARLDLFCDAEPTIRYGTAWVGVFDPVARTLEYSCAGHPPPLLVADRNVHRLDGANTALIGIPQGPRRSEVVNVPIDASLVLYSDGLIETRRASLDEGIARLAGAIDRFGPEPDPIAEYMLEDTARDDDTILAVIDFDYVAADDAGTRAGDAAPDAVDMAGFEEQLMS